MSTSKCCGLVILLWLNPVWVLSVFGQITLDGSVGPGIARDLQPVGNEFQVGADLGTVIGSDASANLFHSFSRFNVNTGQSAIFTGPSHIARVLARVTGGTRSHIHGLLATSGMPNADFFLMNPNGVIFGSGAQLDVGGSFTVTTADALELADGGRFAALIGANDSMLTSAPPEAFGFLGAQTKGISIQDAVLSVAEGRSLSIVAGDVNMARSAISASAGQVNIVSVSDPGQISFENTGQDVNVDVGAFEHLGLIEVIDGSSVAVDGDGGGRVMIRGGQLLVLDSSVTARSLGGTNGRGVDIVAKDQMSIVRGKIDTRSEGQGRSGNVHIVTESLVLDARDAVGEVGVLAGTKTESPTNMRVTLDVTHAFDADIQAIIESPAGTRVELFEGVGGGGDDFTGTVLDDRATTSISDGSAPFTGTFRPQNSLSAFIGESVLGQWVLELTDTFPLADDGTLNSWSVQIGSSVFQSADVGQMIDFDQPVVRSGLSVDNPGLTVTGVQLAGDIKIESSVVEVFGHVTISAAGANLDAPAGDVSVTAPTIFLNGTEGGFGHTWLPGVGCFFPSGGGVVVDHSLGSGATLSGPDFQITADLGTIKGGNLFHSFSRFDLRCHQTATFTGPDHIVNILSRVVGAGVSHIDGQVVSGIEDANLFFINPSGVIVGPTADLNVSGSLTLTTTDVLHMGSAGQGRFGASTDPTDSILSSAAPGAFGFLGGPEARVVVNSDLINDDGISIRAGSVEISGGSRLTTIRGGDIELIGSHQVVLSGINRDGSSSGVSTLHLSSGQPGSIHVDAPIVRFDNGASISTTRFETGLGAGIDVIASESITLSGVDGDGDGAFILALTFLESGNAGTILLKAPRIWLDDGATVSADTFGDGSAGNIEFIASESILLSGANGNGLASAVVAGTTLFGGGDAGTILFDAPRIHLEDGASVDTSTTGSGPAGNIEMMATEAITLSGTSKSGSGSTIASRTFSVGDAGSIKVEAPFVALEDGAQIATSTTSTGDGGAVDFKVDQLHMRNEASLAASSDQVTDGAGTAGNITVLATGSVVINDQSKIATSAANADGGNISVSTGHNLELTNSQMTAQAAQNGGNITIVAPNILRLQDSQIDVQANRDGGDITIDPLLVDLRGRSAITADAVAGSGGNITIQTTILHQSSASRITASSMFGVSGTVNVNSTLDLTGSLVAVSASLLDLDAQLQPHCAVQFGVGEASTFVVSGRGGTPLAPNRWQPSVDLAAPDR